MINNIYYDFIPVFFIFVEWIDKTLHFMDILEFYFKSNKKTHFCACFQAA